jgi:hypothetical protein
MILNAQQGTCTVTFSKGTYGPFSEPPSSATRASRRKATAMARALMRNKRPWLCCTGSSPRGDGALGSRAGSSCARCSNQFGARRIFPRQIHLHLHISPHPQFPQIHLHLPLSSPIWVRPRCRRRLQLGRRRARHRWLWMRRRP